MDGEIRHLEAYDDHQLTLLGSLTCDVEWKGSRLAQKQPAVVQSDKEFGLLGRDLLPKHGVNNITAEHLLAVKAYKALVKLMPGSQSLFSKARKKPLPFQDKLRLCVDLKVHVVGKVMNEDYPLPEAKLILLDGIKAKPAVSVTEMTESLQFRTQAMAFASSSSGKKPFNVKEEVGFNFKKTFRKPNEKITADKSNMCTRCGAKPHSSRPFPALSRKCSTCEKVGHFSKMCRSKPQPNSGKYNKQNNFCGEENVSSEQASPASEMGMFYTKEQTFSIPVTCEYISIKSCKVKMQVDTGADSTVISSKIWTEPGKPQLDGKIRHLEAYDDHQLTLLGSLTCDVERNGSRLAQKQLAVVQSDKEFGLLGRDLLPKHGVNNITAEHLPAAKAYKALVKLIPGSQPLFSKARKKPLHLQDKLRLCVDLHIVGKVMDEDYPIPDMETIFHNLHGASYFGKIDLSDAYYQIELDEEAKDICTINTSQGLFKMCRLPQGLKNSSSIFQNCIELTLKRIKSVVLF